MTPHHPCRPGRRVVEPLEKGVGRERRELRHLVDDHVARPAAQCDPPRATEKPGDRKPFGKTFVGVPVVVLP